MPTDSSTPTAGIDAPEARIPFNREDEETLRSVAGWATAVAVLSLASTVFGAGLSFMHQGMTSVIASTPTLAITVLLAVFLLGAASSLRRVASTDVADKLYLVDGLRKLRNYFLTTAILFIIIFGFAALALLFALTCGMLQ